MPDRLHPELDTITALYEVSRAATSSLDLRLVVEQTLEVLAGRMGVERGMLVLKDPGSDQASIEAAHGLTENEIRRGRYRAGEGVVGRVMSTGEPMAVPNVGTDPLFLNRTQSRGDLGRAQISFVCVPVKVGDETVGALAVDLLWDAGADLDEDVRMLSIVAGYIAQAVRIQRMVESEKKTLADENIQLKRALAGEYRLENLVGASSGMRAVFEQVMLVAKSKATVLITGESGTGKELVAKAIHVNSQRSQCPFVGVSCASLPAGIMENELFGHVQGAFTGATRLQKGRFEIANTGTIFLDEIGEIPLNLQVKLLRVLQEREIERLGGKETIAVDVRVIAATNRDLAAEMKHGTFREDLYYRLNVVPIHLPPLRERRLDIPLLASHFLRKYNEENGKEVKGFTTEAMDTLMNHPWPGNVRELENLVERAVVMAQKETIDLDHLWPVPPPESIDTTRHPLSLEQSVSATAEELFNHPPAKGVYKALVERVEAELIDRAMARVGQVKLDAAKLLGINRNTLHSKLATRSKE